MKRATLIARRASYPVTEDLAGEILDALAPSLVGRTVLIKPNCLMAAEPERGVTTHPSLVAALVAALRRRKATVWVGDSPGARGYGAVEEAFRISGLLEAAGDCYVDFARNGKQVDLPSRFIGRAVVAQHLFEADYVISVPKLKTHCMTLLTGAVKNMYGILIGAEKVRVHAAARSRKDFAEAVADVYAIRPPDLAVMDAVVAMEGDGPSQGPLRRTGMILASDNPVALDVGACRLMGVAPDRVEHLALVARRGLGPGSLEEISVDGPLERAEKFRIPSPFRMGLIHAVANRVVFNYLDRSRLLVDGGKCVSCGECAEACPAGALEESGDGYRIRPELCHQCYCCYELCPEGAVTVRGAMAALRKEKRS